MSAARWLNPDGAASEFVRPEPQSDVVAGATQDGEDDRGSGDEGDKSGGSGGDKNGSSEGEEGAPESGGDEQLISFKVAGQSKGHHASVGWDDSVYILKRVISAKVGIKCRHFFLTLRDDLMEETRLLKDFDFEGSIVHVHIIGSAGGKRPRASAGPTVRLVQEPQPQPTDVAAFQEAIAIRGVNVEAWLMSLSKADLQVLREVATSCSKARSGEVVVNKLVKFVREYKQLEAIIARAEELKDWLHTVMRMSYESYARGDDDKMSHMNILVAIKLAIKAKEVQEGSGNGMEV